MQVVRGGDPGRGPKGDEKDMQHRLRLEKFVGAGVVHDPAPSHEAEPSDISSRASKGVGRGMPSLARYECRFRSC
jgi:hypothetical protein